MTNILHTIISVGLNDLEINFSNKKELPKSVVPFYYIPRLVKKSNISSFPSQEPSFPFSGITSI